MYKCTGGLMSNIIECHVVVRPSKPLNLNLATANAPTGETLAEIITRNEEQVNAETPEHSTPSK